MLFQAEQHIIEVYLSLGMIEPGMKGERLSSVGAFITKRFKNYLLDFGRL